VTNTTGRLIGSCALALALLSCLWLLAPPGAGAAVCVPPGVSGASQYVETVPGSSCNRTPSGPRRNGGPGGALPPGAAGRLAGQGPLGQSVARLVASTGTAPQHAGSGTASPGAQSGAGAPTAGGHGWLWGLVHPVLSGSSSGGLGDILPLLLLLILVVTLARWSARRLRPRSRQR
jgi:hypothetical protein